MKVTTQMRILIILILLIVTGAIVLFAGQLINSAPAKVDGQTVLGAPLQEAAKLSEQPKMMAAQGSSDFLQALDASVMEVLNDKTLSNEKKFNFLWDGYQKNKVDVMLATYYIDGISSVFPLLHIEKILTELASPMNGAEIKNHLLQLLYYGYVEEKALNQQNRQLALHAIQSNIQNDDPKVAGEAVRLYARMGAKDDLIKILDEALERNIISPLDYIREGVFQLANITEPKAQNALLMKIINIAQQSDSSESESMLVGTISLMIQSPSRLARIDPGSKSRIKKYLENHEPKVESEGIHYDMVNAIDYTNWLKSYALLNTKSEAEVPGWVLNHIVNRPIETQKIVALVTSPMGADVVRLARQTGQADAMKNRVARELDGLRPGNTEYSAFEAALDILNF